MRIIAGEFGGRLLEAPEGEETRPTTDRVRESLFSVVANMLSFENIAVLDLYAGSGALGFEALSRGASTAVFVDESPRAAKIIDKNAKSLTVTERVYIVKRDVFSSFGEVKSRLVESGHRQFSLIFADPPYQRNPGILLLKELTRQDLVTSGSLLVFETEGDFVFDNQELINSKVRLLRHKQYGNTALHIFYFD